ncbi:NERD domain-containing protein [Rhabdothermincola salaria]|uniref:NERD domain-containing protein n=1 Tax=Rhabdothermincola salaria TaxID=2903142 RepID=UPI001E43A38C|nr:NERD domain-containing protein [Rhabdothermincola salaria]MCD9623930.1 NERD domain-containing protein [Rhabdothermincola salaria]
MGTLIPEDFDLDTLANDAERVVVRALVDGLFDSWLVIPDVGLHTKAKDHQSDIVLVHPEMGVVLLEVKGHRMAIRQGQWVGQEGTPLKPQPVAQAKDNAYALRRRIRKEVDGLDHLEVEYGIALPNTRAVDGNLPTDVDPAQVLVSENLAGGGAVTDAVEHLALLRRWSTPLTQTQLEGIVALLRPDVDFAWDPEARTTATRERLRELCETQVGALVPLMANRRVVVTGGAGTGKTRLAVGWAWRAWNEGDRVLLTCFNEPLARCMADEMCGSDGEPVEDLDTGAFLRFSLGLPGMPRLTIPDDADAFWWDNVAVGHLHKHWPLVGAAYDTIVVDEAQDFSPAWLAQLAALLDPDGRRRMLLLADEEQALFDRGFVIPHPDDGWVRAELLNNCRNALPIARILRYKLGGAPAPAASPDGLGVHWRPAADLDAVVAAVGAELSRLIDDEGRDPAGICVGTFHTDVRQALRRALDLVAHDERLDPDEVVCENVHRLKGLEFDTLILAGPDDEDDLMVLYVGVSRAVTELVVVGPEPLADRLGLRPRPV